MKEVDILIVGAGPIGLACGIEAKKAGLSYKIIDKGCLVNSIYNYPKNLTFFSTSDKLEIGGIPFISHNPKPTRSEALEYFRRLASSWQLNTGLYETVTHIHRKNKDFTVSTTKTEYTARNIVLATGFYDLPYLLNVPGEELPKVKHYYDEPHPYFDMDVAVVGAANSSIDVALEVFRKGAKSVSLIVRKDEISPRVKYWVRPDIDNRIKEGSIKAYFNSNITEIKPNAICIDTPEGAVEISNDYVLAMTGYQPNFSFLKSLGVQIGEDEFKTPTYNEKTMESNVEDIYLAGVICGGLKTNTWFIENSIVHAAQIIRHISEKKQPNVNF